MNRTYKVKSSMSNPERLGDILRRLLPKIEPPKTDAKQAIKETK